MPKNSYRYAGIDFIGQKHGRLTVLRKSNRGRSWWICKCDCGNEVELPTHRFLEYKSCGCLERENKSKIGHYTLKHGMTDTRLYHIWCGMKDRCYNEHYRYFDRYGGKGVTVCEEWRNSFETFKEWAYANGYNPMLGRKEQSIDRIDIDGDYEPDNCRWTSQTEQVRNRSNAVVMVYRGEEMNPYEFAKLTGITDKVFIYRRLKKGHSAEKILADWKSKHG